MTKRTERTDERVTSALVNAQAVQRAKLVADIADAEARESDYMAKSYRRDLERLDAAHFAALDVDGIVRAIAKRNTADADVSEGQVRGSIRRLEEAGRVVKVSEGKPGRYGARYTLASLHELKVEAERAAERAELLAAKPMAQRKVDVANLADRIAEAAHALALEAADADDVLEVSEIRRKLARAAFGRWGYGELLDPKRVDDED